MGIKIKRWLMVMSVGAMVLSGLVVCAAEESKEQAPAADFLKAFAQAQQDELERLKERDPQQYQRQKAALDRQKKIQEVIGLYSNGKLSLTEAKAALSPLVKEQMQEEGTFSVPEARIQRLEEKLAFLKEARKQPELLIQERIDQMLGKPVSSPLGADGFGN